MRNLPEQLIIGFGNSTPIFNLKTALNNHQRELNLNDLNH